MSSDSTKKKYVLWSDGVVTSMGTLVEEMIDGKLKVQNPVTVIFAIQNVPLDEQHSKTMLRWEIVPYLFNACIKSGANEWIVTPRHQLLNDQIADNLIDAYEKTVEVSAKVKETAPSSPSDNVLA